jgi:TM2 domain-containing membrane protein YozV
MFQSTTQINPTDPPKNAIIAAVLSLLLFGGVGQLYLGQQKKGIILIVAWLVFWLVPCVGPLIASIIGAIDAFVIGDKLQKGQSVGDMQWFWEN